MTLTKNAGGLQELASGSLPSLGGDPLQPSWSRSLAELLAANQALIGTSGAPQPTAAAQVLLGSTRTDFGSLVIPKPTTGSTPTATFASVEERCRRHRDGIMERILQNERERCHRAFEKATERRQQDDWTKEREWWMKEIVGTRNLVDAKSALKGTSVLMLTGPTSSNLLPGFASPTMALLNSRMAQDHKSIIQSMPKGSLELVTKLEVAASDSNPGYTTAWQLLGCMLPHLSSPIGGALGSLIHFCKQYQAFIKNRVASASLAGQDIATRLNFGSGMAGTIAAFCKLEKGSAASVWCNVYYCKFTISRP